MSFYLPSKHNQSCSKLPNQNGVTLFWKNFWRVFCTFLGINTTHNFVKNDPKLVRDRRQKTFGFLSRLCLLGGEGVKTNLLKIVNFQTKVCCFKLQSLHHSHYKATIWIHICCLSTCWIFDLCRLSWLGRMRTGL